MIEIKTLNRVIAHKIFKKESDNALAYAECSDSLLCCSESEKRILIDRVDKAMNNRSKTLELAFDTINECCVRTLLGQSIEQQPYRGDENAFINLSVSLAEKLADSQSTKSIPGGYCIVGDGITENGHYFLFLIKADNQEAFSIRENSLNLLQDVFLSPAKDFYKVAFFEYCSNTLIKPYMYDDLFSSAKRDLTAYFYRDCLGLTTDKNDKLRTRNFYNDTFNFIEMNITNPTDAKGMEKALQVYVRENTTGIISASDFSKNHLTGCKEQQLYEKEIIAKYPLSFSLDTTLLSKQKLDVERIALGRGITIVSNTDLQDVEVLSNPTKEEMKLKMDTGRVKSVVFLMEKDNK